MHRVTSEWLQRPRLAGEPQGGDGEQNDEDRGQRADPAGETPTGLTRCHRVNELVDRVLTPC